jgi:hypothetical protein
LIKSIGFPTFPKDHALNNAFGHPAEDPQPNAYGA